MKARFVQLSIGIAILSIFINQMVYSKKIKNLEDALRNPSLNSMNLFVLENLKSQEVNKWGREFGLDIGFPRVYNIRTEEANVEFDIFNPGLLRKKHVIFRDLPYHSEELLTLAKEAEEKLKGVPESELGAYIGEFNNEYSEYFIYSPYIEIDTLYGEPKYILHLNLKYPEYSPKEWIYLNID